MRRAAILTLALLALAPLATVAMLVLGVASSSADSGLLRSLLVLPELLANTFVIVGAATALAWMLAVPSALVLAAKPPGDSQIRRLRVVIDFGSAIPRLLWGVAGATLFGVGLGLGFSVLCGILTLSCLLAPLICTTLVDGLALQAARLRDPCEAIGMTRWQMARYGLFPAIAVSRRTALRLALSRGLGDAAALYLTSGTIGHLMASPMDPAATLSVSILTSLLETPGGHVDAFVHALVLLALSALIQTLFNRR